MKEIGLISIVKSEVIASRSTSGSIPQKISNVLPGLQVIIGLSFCQRTIQLPAQAALEAENAEDEKLQYAVSKKVHDRKAPESYTGKPKVKKALEDRPGGRKIYPRDEKTSLNALRLAKEALI